MSDDGSKVLAVDTKEAVYKGFHWKELGDFGKRKFENLLFIQHPKDRIKVLYIT